MTRFAIDVCLQLPATCPDCGTDVLARADIDSPAPPARFGLRDADVLLQCHKGDAGLGERVEDGDDLTQRAAEPGEFADDQAVAALEAVQQLVEPASLLGSLPGGGRLDEVADAEVVLARVLEDGEALAAHVLLRDRDPQVGDGSHGLSTERSVGHCTGRLEYGTRRVPCC